MSKPTVSIRLELDKLELVKDILGLEGKGETIRTLINEKIESHQNLDRYDFVTIASETITVQEAANMLGFTDANIKLMIYKKKLKAIQPGGKNSAWRIYLSSVKVLLVPNVSRLS